MKGIKSDGSNRKRDCAIFTGEEKWIADRKITGTNNKFEREMHEEKKPTQFENEAYQIHEADLCSQKEKFFQQV